MRACFFAFLLALPCGYLLRREPSSQPESAQIVLRFVAEAPPGAEPLPASSQEKAPEKPVVAEVPAEAPRAMTEEETLKSYSLG